MIGVYEFQDLSLAVDLFCWTYERSMNKYVVVMNSMGVPNPLRIQYRESLNQVVGLVIRRRLSAMQALEQLELTEDTAPGLKAMLLDELQKLQVHHGSRYRLDMNSVQAWINDGRPH